MSEESKIDDNPQESVTVEVKDINVPAALELLPLSDAAREFLLNLAKNGVQTVRITDA